MEYFTLVNGAILAAAVGATYFVKQLRQGEKYKKDTSAKGKIIIVTGCNTGIGKETVRELAKRNATIYMACRDLNRCKAAREEIVAETKNENVYCRVLDLSSLKSIREFAESFKKEQSKLDILINNAGVMSGPRKLTEDGFEMQIGVNHLGHFYLTNLLLDLLKKAAPSRIVNVSSIGHKFGKIDKEDLMREKNYSTFVGYNQSKLANVLFTRELAKRLEGTRVTVNSLHPGVVETELFRNLPFRLATEHILKPLFWPFIKTTKNGAQTTIYAALDPDLEEVSGQYFSDCNIAKVSERAKDDEMAKWLWAESEKLTRLV